MRLTSTIALLSLLSACGGKEEVILVESDPNHVCWSAKFPIKSMRLRIVELKGTSYSVMPSHDLCLSASFLWSAQAVGDFFDQQGAIGGKVVSSYPTALVILAHMQASCEPKEKPVTCLLSEQIPASDYPSSIKVLPGCLAAMQTFDQCLKLAKLP